MEEPITIDVICSNGRMFEAEPRVSVKVADFKEYLAEMLSVPANEQRFIYRGMTLEDDRTLDSYGIQEYHTIHMELANNLRFAETETTPPSDTTTGGLSLQMGKMIIIEIICSDGDMFSVRSSVGSKVGDFKELLAEIYHAPANEQRLIYRGKTLEDDRTLDSYGIEEYHTIHMDLAKNRPTGDMPDMSLLYPAIFQMTKTLLSRPQLRDQIISQNRQLRSMFDSNPELSDIIQHHELVRSLTSPQMMQAPESQLKLSRQNSIRHYIPSAAGPSTSFNAMAPESQHSTLAEDVAAGPSTSAMGLLLQRSSDMKYQIGGWVILAASIVAWRILKS